MKKVSIIIAIMVFASLGCGLPFGTKSKSTATPTINTASLATPAANAASNVRLGEPYLSVEGGYSLKKISGYSFAETSGAITMLAPNADAESGPVVFMAGGLNKTISTNEELMAKFKSTSTAANVTGEKPVALKNVKGLSADLSGKINDKPIKGRLVIAMVTPYHQFMMMANAPAETWDKELAAIFDAVLGSIEFTTPSISGSNLQTTPTAVRTGISATRTNTPPPPSSSGELRQWAKSATASSQASTTARSSAQATGAPNTDNCGDAATAWAPINSDSVEWIELTFEKAVFPTEINILQSWNPSQVSKVEISTPAGERYQIYEGKPVKVEFCPDEYSFSLELTKKIYVNKVRITVDQSVLKIGKVQIDAVELVGIPETTAQTQPTRTPTTRSATATPIQATKAGQPTIPPKPGGPLPAAQAGRVNYQITGSPEDGTILNASIGYNSNDNEYIVKFNNWDKPSILPSFFWLKSTPLAVGEVKLKPYESREPTHGPSFNIIIGRYFYYAKEGSITIEAVEGDSITGKFAFIAFRQDNPNILINVSGVFNKIQIK